MGSNPTSGTQVRTYVLVNACEKKSGVVAEKVADLLYYQFGRADNESMSTTQRAVLHSTGAKVHYVRYTADNRLAGPFRTKRAAVAAVEAANSAVRTA